MQDPSAVEPDVASSQPRERAGDRDASQPRGRQPAAVRAVLLLLLLVNLAMSLYQLPVNRVVERRVCREYYAARDPAKVGPGGGVDEQLCKIEAVQKTLGSLQGAMETIWIVGDFAMTLPLGFIAQRRGRRFILLLNLSSRIFMLSWAVVVGYFDSALPINAIVVGPILSVLGGDCVFNSMTYALVSDFAEDPVQRAIYFGYMSSISYVVALSGPALASATMSVFLWLPFCLGVMLLLLATTAIASLPPTAGDNRRPSSQHDEEHRQHLLSSPILKAQDATHDASILHSVAAHAQALLVIVTSHPRNFTLLLTSFVLTSLASSDTKLLAQYISVRYRWTFAATGYLLSGKAVVNFTLLAFVIPRLLRALHASDSGSVDRANMRHAKLCLGVSVIGALGIASAAEIWILFPSLLVYALGSALPIFTLSLLKSPAISPPSRDDTPNPESHIFSIVMLCKTVGSLLGAPLMAALWVSGIGVGGLALGLPYVVSAACYAIAIAVFARIRI
ncbi:hypothetical protein S40285_09124 [Stachybotrys chlorohalonatus IBT 40285]|uniref:Major facilitator superfamily (MFS) profile domain-containing protein n=1 Tax=Stachybotrys chlorohalonatus (strain IBT 40285) TaxID=1283841 RepID=A0A084QIE1_STAC4|nr:hypothetical protein S40285_09124 [Stachybotrys chlorohalonata IBT 40285]